MGKIWTTIGKVFVAPDAPGPKSLSFAGASDKICMLHRFMAFRIAALLTSILKSVSIEIKGKLNTTVRKCKII